MKLSALLLVATLGVVSAGGKWRLFQLHEDPDLCIGVKGENQKEGKKLKLVDCDDDDDDQMWRFDSNDRIVAKDDDDLCWEPKHIDDGSRIKLEDCRSSSKQRWKYDKNNDNEITPKRDDDLCVTYDSKNPSEGDSVILDDCSEDSSQEWKKTDSD